MESSMSKWAVLLTVVLLALSGCAKNVEADPKVQIGGPGVNPESWTGNTPSPEALGEGCDLTVSIDGVAAGTTSVTVTQDGDLIFKKPTFKVALAETGSWVTVLLQCRKNDDLQRPFTHQAEATFWLAPGDRVDLTLDNFAPPPVATLMRVPR
jgi:hypothetical protein